MIPSHSAMSRCLALAGTVVVGLVFITGCLDDAGHGNPLDPMSDGFEEVGTLTGQVTSFYAPFRSLDGVEVRLTPGPFVALTDAQGQFTFRRIPVGTYVVQAGKEGFAAATDTVAVTLGPPVETTLRLDGLPTVVALTTATVHVSRWWPPPLDLFRLEVSAQVDDPDGVADVEEVFLEIPELGFSTTLQSGGEPGRFTQSIPEATFPTGALQALMGRPFRLRLRDRAGFERMDDPWTLVRVIEETPVAVDPQGLTVLNDPTPLLTWERVRLPYPFTFQVEIIRQEANVQVRERLMTGLPPESTSVQVAAPLAPGSYLWTVSIVDEFGNRSGSKEVGFIIP